jgi:dihydroxy-acid dehydratase
MSGTAYGTVVLHVAPEAAVNGPLNAVRTGDIISIDVLAGLLQLEISDEELQRRLAASPPFESPHTRGYARMYVDHVLQADKGADLDFLVGSSGSHVERESH